MRSRSAAKIASETKYSRASVCWPKDVRAFMRLLYRAAIEIVFEIVEVLAALGDDDAHLAAEPCKLAGAGIRHDDDVEPRRAARHRREMLQHERAAPSAERADDLLDRDVAGRALRAGHRAQHLAFRRRFEI